MLLFILILIVIGVVIFLDWHTKQIIQQCNNYINQICDNGGDIKHPEKIIEFMNFIKKHSIKTSKLLRTNNEFNELIKNFDIKLGSFTREIIHEKELSGSGRHSRQRRDQGRRQSPSGSRRGRRQGRHRPRLDLHDARHYGRRHPADHRGL